MIFLCKLVLQVATIMYIVADLSYECLNLVAPDKVFFSQKLLIFFIFLHKDMLWCSLEIPRRGLSNDYPQGMFLWRNEYSRLLLSQIPRDSLKYFEISIPRLIRFAKVRKK